MTKMKLKFENGLEYQDEAINSICDLFRGDEMWQNNFTISNPKNQIINEFGNIGTGNTLNLLDTDLLTNMQQIQLRNGLPQATEDSFKKNGMNFSVEMETGTGKTYVYLKTILELHRRYNYTKFIIVVPSIAIKEGTYKTLEITKEHFKGLYNNEIYEYSTYTSGNMNQIRDFASSTNIKIMVINIDAFRKDTNLINQPSEKLGCIPIGLIQQTNPIVIIDEPQSVDNTEKSKDAIAALHPLFCLRYSATHREVYNLMYKLDAVDAYDMKLVKEIEVAPIEVEGQHNEAYIQLESVTNTEGIKAKLDVDIQGKNGKVKRATKWVKTGDDLEEITNREVYHGYIIKDIYYQNMNDGWCVTFTSNSTVVQEHKSIGCIDEDLMKREQIHLTIEAHLDKELILNPKNIKVLSLFFIDKVSNYRKYDEQGIAQKGKYAQMFEEEYNKLIKKEKYATLFNQLRDRNVSVDQVHDGYFSIDPKKKDNNGNSNIFVDTRGTGQTDNSTYNTIMKNKEWLLSFDCPLRFIFSHSTLCEGWDNPNVFQICTLVDTTNEMTKRQKIGRGLRLCVNQQGERVKGFDVNTLTVVANESYQSFCSSLQKEMDKDGIIFGVMQRHSFAKIIIGMKGDEPIYLDEEKSNILYEHFLKQGYIAEEKINKKTGECVAKIQDTLKQALKDKNVNIPEEFENEKDQIVEKLKRISGNYLNIKNREDAKRLTIRKEILLGEDFKALWDRIKYKTTYSVSLNSDNLIKRCSKRIKEELIVGQGKFVIQRRKVTITEGGLQENAPFRETTHKIDYEVKAVPDIITCLQNITGLTRKTIITILQESERLDAFKKNPQAFIEGAADIIHSEMRQLLADGVKYRKLDDQIWCQELFVNEELQGYINNNIETSNKSPYNYVIYDSSIEKSMTQKLESSEKVKVYAKLPSWFKIDTPLGSYNPDWAIVLNDENGANKLYFVVETKGSNDLDCLRATEEKKIDCGKKHFEALNTGAKMIGPTNPDAFHDNYL